MVGTVRETTQSVTNSNSDWVPPVEWMETAEEISDRIFTQHTCLTNPSLMWDFLCLSVTACQAQLAQDGDQLLCLEYIHNFQPLRHQISCAQDVIHHLHGRAVLADEVGLGKTIEAGLVIKEYQVRKLAQRVLILVPASLIIQWSRELTEKFGISCYAPKKRWAWSEYDVVVASLDTAKREPHRAIITEIPWDLVVIDEAHKLKNRLTRNWEFVNQIPNKYMLLLTATPVQNNLQELHSLITLLKPGELGNNHNFVAKHLVSKRKAKDAQRLRAHLSTLMIRNRRADGQVYLPDREVKIVSLEFSPEEKQLYDDVQKFLKEAYQEAKTSHHSVLPLLTLQREVCSSPYAAMVSLDKMARRTHSPQRQAYLSSLLITAKQIRRYTKVEKVLELIHTMDDKCIIFTEYRATQDFLMYLLHQNGVKAVPFRGGFKRGKKDWMTELFEHRAQVLVATESGGEGINLQFCRHMINFDLPWNPMRLEQRIGRIHRLGQQSTVKIYNLSTRNTIEEHIVALLVEKIHMFETVVGELDSIIGDLQIQKKIESDILDITLTAKSQEEIKNRMEDYGASMWTRYQTGRYNP